MKTFAAVVVMVGLALNLRAGETESSSRPSSGGSEEKELAELMSILDQETEVATKTRLNSDFVPGIVTVLEGDELEALGARTVWEALAFVPGVEAIRGNSDVSTIVRGLDFPFNSGNIQIRVNSVPLSREAVGINGSVLLIPIEQVDRIEFIRGPGSVVYGDFAFMGLVNIVTRSEGTRLFLRGDSDETLSGGARVGWKSAAKTPWKVLVNISQMKSNDPPLPEPSGDGDEKRRFGVVSGELGNFAATLQFVDRELHGPGVAAGNQIRFDETSWAASARWGRQLTPALHSEAHVEFLNTDIGGDVVTFGTSFTGDQARVGADLQWQNKRHSLLASVDYSSSDIDRAEQLRPPPFGSPPGTPPEVFAITNRDRQVSGLTLQDRIDLNDRFSVTLGGRFESYSDLSDRFTPRLALVWRASDRHIVKAQYAEGFRPPTFFEEYRADESTFDLDFEVNRTTELNYVYKIPRRVVRATLFHTELDDMIFISGPGPTFGNVRDAQSEGVELEWTEELGPRFKVMSNVSWIDTEDTRTIPEVRMENQVSANWLGNVSVFWRPLPDTIGAAHWNHVGDRAAGSGYDMVDFTVSRQNIFAEGLDLRAGVKNAFDDDIVYFNSRPNGAPIRLAYPDRTWWVQVGWRR